MDIRRLPISPVLPGLLALLLGLTATSMLSAWTRQQEQDNEHLLFERRASYRAQTIRQGVEDVIEALNVVNRACVTFYPVSREQFSAFAEPVLQHHPFVDAISFLRILPGEQRAAYERQMRSQIPGFSITELSRGELRPAPPRASYLVAEYLLPQHDWKPIPGFNAASVPELTAALNSARDSGLAAAAGLFRYAANETLPLRFAAVKAVYRPGAAVATISERRAALLGYTSIGMPVGALVNHILNDSDLQSTPGLHLEVEVGNPDGPAKLAYSDAGAPRPDAHWAWLRGLPQPAQLQFSQRFTVAGVSWTVRISEQRRNFLTVQAGSLLVAMFGTLISLLAAGYLRLLGTGAERIQRLVRERTAALHAANNRLSADIAMRTRIEAMLRRAQQSLTNAQRIAHVGSWELDLETGIQLWSEECFRIFGLEPDASGVPALAQLPEETLHAWCNALSRLASGDAASGLECRIVRVDGKERQVKLHGEMVPDAHREGQILAGSALDISDFKQVETELRQSQASLRQLASHQERIKESERKRIAREIHDELGGLLTGIKAYVSVAGNQTRGKDAKAENLLSEALALADTALDTVRRVISDLRPSVLDQLGVWEAIAWQASQVEAQTGIPCRCVLDPELPSVDGDNGAMLFRIVQEALTNIARHAGASAVEIRAWGEQQQLILEVEDNGVGIAAGSAASGTSWGLRGMEERARYLGGILALQTTEEGGTLVRLCMPAIATT
jgi:PAS domain S-box-containing protein